MAIKVRLKDASENVLHPETDWSVVLNKPSFETIEDGYGNVSQKWNANAKGENIEIDGGNVSIYSRDTGIYLNSSDSIELSGGNVYINGNRPFTVCHSMSIGGCNFQFFDDQDKALGMSDLKLIGISEPIFPASGFDSSNNRMFYSAQIKANGIYASYVKFVNGTVSKDVTNLGTGVTETERHKII